MNTETNPRIHLGANNPPTDEQLAAEADARLREHLDREAAAILQSARDVINEAKETPETVADDVAAGSIGDIVLKITKVGKSLDAMRVKEKEPHLRAGRVVDGFFKTPMEHLEKVKGALSARLTAYQRVKAEEERKRREEEARRIREEEDRKRQEALRLAREAEELARLKQDGLAAQSASEAAAVQEQAETIAQDAAKAEKAAEAKSADMSRTRGVLGSVQSLRETIVAEQIGDEETFRKSVDLEKLRPYLALDALQKAANLFVKAGGRDLGGFKIYARQDVVIR